MGDSSSDDCDDNVERLDNYEWREVTVLGGDSYVIETYEVHWADKSVWDFEDFLFHMSFQDSVSRKRLQWRYRIECHYPLLGRGGQFCQRARGDEKAWRAVRGNQADA